ncbi:MAG TPA: choice-of-anchor D domain-containing protein [Candidatus Sulfotelmatobacter sp.]|nr:choice-of-anchor D domain-containing protein [Candidatus Sulfotelmatobacter sp.]
MSSRTRPFLSLALLLVAVCAPSFGQTMSTFTGLNTTQSRLNATAAPDVTIAVGLTEYCEHVNSAYQCWYKGGPNANQPVKFQGNTNPKSDNTPWSQNSDNGGNTPHCPAAFTPNSQLIHDNVYNVWVLEKRITSTATGHNYMCVAMSNVDDISSPAFSWFAFEFDLDTVIPTNSHGNFYYPDYPQAGLWQSSVSLAPPYAPDTDQAMWITYDLQDINNSDNVMGVLVCAVDIAGMRASTASPYVNNSKTPACAIAHPLTTFNQRRSWVPASNDDTTPPISGDGEMLTYVISPPKDNHSYLTDPNHSQGVEQWTINWATATPAPTFVNSWDLPSTQPNGDQLGCFLPSGYYNTICVPQPSTAATGIHIDSVADRMQQFFHYTSNGGQGSIWTSTHAIQITPSQSSVGQTEADVRTLQRNTTGSNSVFVAADYTVNDPDDGNAWVFMPSVVRDRAGSLLGIFNVSGNAVNEHPGLQSFLINPATQQISTYGYIANPANSGDAEDTDTLAYRWGDWSSAVLDPSDSCTVWVAGEFLASNRTTEPFWYTQMASLPPASTCAGDVLLSSASLNFGSQQLNVKSSALTETLTNNQSVALNVSSITASGDFSETDNCGQQLAAMATCTINVFFTPTATGTRNGTLTINDDAANSPQTATLTGTGVSTAISLSATSLAFGNQVLNTTSAGQSITVTNTGFGSVTISSVLASGSYSQSGNCSGAILTQGQSCTVTASFTPVVTGTINGTITINDNATGAPHVVSMTGSAMLAVSLSANLTFPALNVGSTSAAQTMTLTNNQSQTMSFTFVTSGDFSAIGGGATPCNGTLAGKSKCTFSVTFSPTINGQIKGALTITYNAPGSPSAGGLSGTGQNGPNPPLTFTPANLGYGNVVLNTPVSKTVTVRNGGSAAITFSSITGSGAFAAALSGTAPCTGTLNAGKTCSISVTFTPQVTGTLVGGITIIDNASVSTQVIDASGAGILAATMSPTNLNFGTVSVGSTSAVQVVTVTNNQVTATPINSVVASGDYVYTTGGGVPCGANIPANGICTLGVAFSPTVTGAVNGILTLSYAAGSSPQVVSLSGTGH